MDDKTGIALHLAFMKYQTEYTYANERDRVDFLYHQPGYNSTIHLFAFPFYKRNEQESLPYHTKKTYCLHLNPFPPYGNIADALTLAGQNTLRMQVYQAIHGTSDTYGDFGTCLHGALFCALMLGFQEIHVIGAGMSTVGGKNHFEGAEGADKAQRPGNPDFSTNAHEERLVSTRIILEEIDKMIPAYWHKTYAEAEPRRSWRRVSVGSS